MLYHLDIGSGLSILMLHGFGLDHRSMMGYMEPLFQKRNGWRRIYADLPGMGRTGELNGIESADDLLGAILSLVDDIIGDQSFLIVGESYGGYLARGVLAKRISQVAGMLLVCPVVEPDKSKRNLPERTVLFRDERFVATLTDKEKETWESIAVIQDRRNWEMMKRELLPGEELSRSHTRFLAKIKRKYAFTFNPDLLESPFHHPVLIVTGRQDHITGFHDAWSLMKMYPRASFAVLDGAGHYLAIEQRETLRALVGDWLDRVMKSKPI
ncbi:alpha/beta fold hydrolase [Polycladomyces subterraneus]|uniref:Alpha/beta hydrolase n=1 Tax=Polycladomyces subterraneus TaxID=1016997 RepID=A0ABT8IK59_9BACL|nr:alpha/beta hydrolase [Polycladomyces subterraneus]MDN4593180.1 alpha/beta hydrolase [Polycladomyces subterraneus]